VAGLVPVTPPAKAWWIALPLTLCAVFALVANIPAWCPRGSARRTWLRHGPGAVRSLKLHPWSRLPIDPPTSTPIIFALEPFLLAARFSIYVLLCRVNLAASSPVLNDLGSASRVLLITSVAASQIVGIILCNACKGIPNVFGVQDICTCNRNWLSIHLAILSGVALLGVGFHGLPMTTGEVLDKCALVGLQTPARFVGIVFLDLPHLIISLWSFSEVLSSGQGVGAGVCLALSISAAFLGVVMLVLGCTAYRVDTVLFAYGTGYHNRISYLDVKARSSVRWRAMQSKVRKARTAARLSTEGGTSLP